jgi:hypothetical protein
VERWFGWTLTHNWRSESLSKAGLPRRFRSGQGGTGRHPRGGIEQWGFDGVEPPSLHVCDYRPGAAAGSGGRYDKASSRDQRQLAGFISQYHVLNQRRYDFLSGVR